MVWRPQALSREQREERRLHAGRFLMAGQLSQAEIGRQVGVSRMALSKWAKQLEQSGNSLAGLKNRPITGRRFSLTDARWQQVLQILAKGTLKDGWESARWTLSRIRDTEAEAVGRRLTNATRSGSDSSEAGSALFISYTSSPCGNMSYL